MEPKKTQEVENPPKEPGSFEKIAVVQKNPSAPGGAEGHALPKKFKLPKKLLFCVIAFFIISTIAIGIPGFNFIRKTQKTIVSGRAMVQAFKSQDLEASKKNIPIVRNDLQEAKKALMPLVWIKFIPFLRGYYNDIDHGLNAGIYGVDAIEIVVTTLEPYADLLGLKGQSTFVSGSADSRIQTAVKTLAKVTPRLADIGVKIELLKKEVDQINPNRYPKKIGKTVLRERLVSTKVILEETTGLFIDARPLLEELPSILGEPAPKRYFVIFQNDKELRATGGFITAYAVFRMESGKPVVEISEDIYVLDEQHGKHPSAPEQILTYHKGVYTFNLRDSNLSPDFKVSMQQFKDLYRGDFNFDGIIAVDTHVLVEALKILGSFTIAGREFSSEIDKRCDCPKVVYELEDYATRPVAYVRAQRKDILGDLLLQIIKKALGVSPSQYWGRLVQMGLTEANQKHILANVVDEKTQKGIESLNIGGRIADGVPVLGYTDTQGLDYLHINDTNFAGAKSNLFVQESVKIDYEVAGDGTITKTLTIDYKNPSPASDCNLESGGLCLNGLLRNWIRIYVPKGSQLIENKGSQSPKDEKPNELRVEEDLGKTVFEGFLTVRPLGSAQLIVKYTLPFKASKDYKMLIQKQPGTEGNDYAILIKGKQKDMFKLTTDRVVTLPL